MVRTDPGALSDTTVAWIDRRGNPPRDRWPWPPYGGLEGQPPDLAGYRAEIDQATGMLTEQLSVGIAGGIYPAARLRLCQ